MCPGKVLLTIIFLAIVPLSLNAQGKSIGRPDADTMWFDMCTEDMQATYLSGYIDGQLRILQELKAYNATWLADRIEQGLVYPLIVIIGQIGQFQFTKRVVQWWADHRNKLDSRLSAAEVLEMFARDYAAKGGDSK